MKMERKETGDAGEQLALQFLKNRSYTIVECNYRCTIGEIDIVASIEEYLVICEVKTRQGGWLHPSVSITPRKIRKLRQLGQFYINHKKKYHLQPRFDVITVQLHPNQEPIIDHFVNAF